MCIWDKDPVEILDVPEDKPIVAYKFLKRGWANPDELMSPNRNDTRWYIGKKISSRTRDPLVNGHGVKVGIYAYASKKALDYAIGSNPVRVKVHLWGKVAVHAAEPFKRRHAGWNSRARKYMYVNHRNETKGRYKGYRAQHAKLVEIL